MHVHICDYCVQVLPKEKGKEKARATRILTRATITGMAMACMKSSPPRNPGTSTLPRSTISRAYAYVLLHRFVKDQDSIAKELNALKELLTTA